MTETKIKPEQTIDSDQPISSSSQDEFGRKHFAKRIADLLIARRDTASIAVGITAPWGEGKSSVLNMIEERLIEKNVKILEVNPWRFSDEDRLLKSFYFDLAKLLDVSLETKKESFGAKFKKYSKFALALELIGVKVEKGLEALSLVFPDVAIEELRTRIEEQLEKKSEHVVVFMDDVDRLDVEEIQAVFRLVKLSASFPHVAYVVAFDEVRVAEALQTKYGQSPEAGRKFLDKILQVTLPVPPASSQVLLRMTIASINAALEQSKIETDDNQNKRFSEYFSKAFRQQITTPRLVKRFANAIAFALPILKGETNPTDVIFLEAIKTFYPKVYSVLRSKGEEILNFTVGEPILGRTDAGLSGELGGAITVALEGTQVSSRAGIDLIIQDLFPGLAELGILSRPHITYPDNNPIKEKRIATREYFWRYFSYGIQPDDISDVEIDDLLSNPILISYDISKYVKGIIKRNPALLGVFVNKLRLREDSLKETVAIEVSEGFAQLSDLFPPVHPDDLVVGGGTRHEIARLLMHLVNSLAPKDRPALLLKIAKDTPDILFSYDFAVMMRAFGEPIETLEKGAWVIAFNGIERDVNKTVVDRITEWAEIESLEEYNFGWAQELYIFWFQNDATSLGAYFQARLEEGLSSFLTSVGGLARFDTTGTKNFTYTLSRQLPWYTMLSTMIDVEKVADLIDTDFPQLQLFEVKPGDRLKQIAQAFLDAHSPQVKARRESDTELLP